MTTDAIRDQAVRAAAELSARDVVVVALTWVDNSGITRVKGVPVGRLVKAAVSGIGASPVFDAFGLTDGIAVARHAGSPVGDLRLRPDLARLVPLAAQPGWAWAPADRFDQLGRPHPQDTRALLRRQVAALAAGGLSALAAIEVEWTVYPASGPGAAEPAPEPLAQGPAYGMHRVIELSDYLRDVVRALSEQGLVVEQLHPEYAPGQFEVSVEAEDPVAAADSSVLVRQTVRAVGARHGLRTSFSPAVVAEGVGNGGHVHLSLWQDGQDVLLDGTGPAGLSAAGEAFAAGILGHLPALLALGAGSVASYLRLAPSRWAGAFSCWGVENREAALRLVTGSAAGSPPAGEIPWPASSTSGPTVGGVPVGAPAAGTAGAEDAAGCRASAGVPVGAPTVGTPGAAAAPATSPVAVAAASAPGHDAAGTTPNLEIKCFDLTANPYLLLAGLLACGRAGLAAGARLPEPVDVDPAALPADERARRGIARLPTRLAEAVAAFERDAVLAEALGPQLHDTVIAVRRAEIDLFADPTRPEHDVRADIVERTRWRH